MGYRRRRRNRSKGLLLLMIGAERLLGSDLMDNRRVLYALNSGSIRGRILLSSRRIRISRFDRLSGLLLATAAPSTVLISSEACIMLGTRLGSILDRNVFRLSVL